VQLRIPSLAAAVLALSLLGTMAAAQDKVAAEHGQKIIREYGRDKYGEGIYNDAAYAIKYYD